MGRHRSEEVAARNAAMLQERLSGDRYRVIAERHGVNSDTAFHGVYAAARLAGVEVPRPPPKPKDEYQPRPDLADRDAAAFDLYQRGWTLRQLGVRFGLSRERARQIVNRTALRLSVPKRAAAPSGIGPRPQRRIHIDPDLIRQVKDGQISAAEACRLSGHSYPTIARCFQETYGQSIRSTGKAATDIRRQRIWDRWQAGEFWQDIARDEGVSDEVFWLDLHKHRLAHGLPPRTFRRNR